MLWKLMNSLILVCISWYSSVPWYNRNIIDETLPNIAALIKATIRIYLQELKRYQKVTNTVCQLNFAHKVWVQNAFFQSLIICSFSFSNYTQVEMADIQRYP